ncbi:MAG: NAD(+) diphosphatase [Ruminococcus sp.]|nr:NAD(+) diphosphatase [Ruminococcus sp.]
MIQDITPHQFNNQYRILPPNRGSYLLYYEKNTCLIREENDEIFFPTFEELEGYIEDLYENYTYLFSIDEESYYLLNRWNPEWLPDYELRGKETFRRAKPDYRAFAGITGLQLANWYKSRQFCGRCGSKMRHDTKERMMRCDSCGLMEYPKICPAVIIGLTDGNRILLSKYAGRTYKNYALLAGFTEIGETVEETVRREVMEEVGLHVKNIQYYKSQPWSFTDTLLMGFFCEVDGDRKIHLDREELALAEWFEREDVPEPASNESLTSDMMMYFKNNKQSK